MDTLILIGENSRPSVQVMIRELYQYLRANFNISSLKPLDLHYFEQKKNEYLN